MSRKVLRRQEQLQRPNEELQTWMREHGNYSDRNTLVEGPQQEEGHPLTRVIIKEVILSHYVIPKVMPLTGEGDL